jgi:hypothetical protein
LTVSAAALVTSGAIGDKSFYAIYMANRFRHIATLWNAAAQWLHEHFFQTRGPRTSRTAALPDRDRFALPVIGVRACPWRWRRCRHLARFGVDLVVSEHLPDAEAAVFAIVAMGHQAKTL